eukprot:COSAG01_NODE_6132_length_3775_cov_3.629183_2_plen_214_part_00
MPGIISALAQTRPCGVVRCGVVSCGQVRRVRPQVSPRGAAHAGDRGIRRWQDLAALRFQVTACLPTNSPPWAAVRTLGYGCGGEIMGSQKCRIVGKSQSVLIMINPIISPRTRICPRCTHASSCALVCAPAALTGCRRRRGVRRYMTCRSSSAPVFIAPHHPRLDHAVFYEAHGYDVCACANLRSSLACRSPYKVGDSRGWDFPTILHDPVIS